MKDIKPYPEYKESGIEWLGEIPAHWEVKRIKYIFEEINERSETGAEDLLSVSHYTGVTKKSDRVSAGELLTNAATLVGYKIVRSRDLVMNIMLAWNGSLGISKYDGITSPAYSVFKSRIGGEDYFGYLFRTKEAQQEFKKQSTGIIDSRLRLYPDSFFNIKTVIPSPAEQIAIANFLDYKLAKITRFIRKKKRLIQLLNEQKAVVINGAVTKGLNPDAPMKESGVEWLGEVPAHWEVRKLSRTYKYFGSGTTPTSGNSSFYENGTISWVNTGDLNDGILENCEKKITQQAFDSSSVLKIYPAGFLSVAMYGASIGKVSIVNFDATTNQACCNFYNSSLLSDKYTFMWFLANKKNIVSLGYGELSPT